MHRRGDDNLFRHLDFAIIDIVMMQLSCLLMYWVTRGGIIYADPDCRLLAYVLLAGQLALGLFSDWHNDILVRDVHDEFFSLLLYTLELWLCCVLFLVLARVRVGLRDVFIVTLVFIDLCFFARSISKALHGRNRGESRKVVLVTSGDLVRRAVARINRGRSETPYEVVAICLTDGVGPSRFNDLSIPVHSTSDPEPLDKLVTMWIDDAFFLAGVKTGYLSTLIEDFVTMGVTVHYSLSAMNDFASVSIGVQSIGDYKVITNSSKLISARAAFIKRAMDICGATVGLALTAVLFVFIAPPSIVNDKKICRLL